ncbi:ferrous iron transport protein A [bacterium]|nr:ferrous iron transport protein A [bacterium]
MTLTQLKDGEYGIIRVINGNDRFKHRLCELGFLRNSEIRMVRKAPFNGPCIIEIKGYTLTMRQFDAEQIEIEQK